MTVTKKGDRVEATLHARIFPAHPSSVQRIEFELVGFSVTGVQGSDVEVHVIGGTREKTSLDGWRPLPMEPNGGGSERVSFETASAPPWLVTGNRLRFVINKVDSQIVLVPPVDGGLADIAQGLDTLTEYPLLIAPAQGPSGRAPDSASTAVGRELRAVLGRSADGDLRGILTAIDQSFTVTEDDGVERIEWHPRAYTAAGSVGTGVTGRQASLAGLAQRFREETLPLLSGLTPLRPAPAGENPDLLPATIAIATSAWTSFVDALGEDGGPNRRRATLLIARAISRLETVGCLIGVLERAPMVNGDGETTPALTRKYVVTPDDERVLTSFVTIWDRFNTAGAAWSRYLEDVPMPGRNASDDLGQQFVRIQRGLERTSETVADVYDALDAVDVTLEERTVTAITDDGLSIEDLLSWVDGFAREEAPSLLVDSGTEGVKDIALTATTLECLVGNLKACKKVREIRHPRVHRTIEDMRRALEEVHLLTAPGNGASGSGAPS